MGSTNRFSCVFRIQITFTLENPRQVLPKIKRHPHFPGSAKYFRVLDRDLVVERVFRSAGKSLDELQGIAMIIPGVVKPSLVVETNGLDNQSLSFPMAP